MKCMTGSDRLFRAAMGLVILVLGIYFQSWWGAVGLFPLMVGAIGRCPNFSASSSKYYLDRERLHHSAGSDVSPAQESK